MFLYSQEMARFEFAGDHPYRPERAAKTDDLCLRYGVLDQPWMRVLPPEPAEESLLALFHEPAYVALLKAAAEDGQSAGKVGN